LGADFLLPSKYSVWLRYGLKLPRDYGFDQHAAFSALGHAQPGTEYPALCGQLPVDLMGEVRLTTEAYGANIKVLISGAGVDSALNLEVQVDTRGSPTPSPNRAVMSVRGRAVPLWDAAEPLWRRLHGVYGDAPPDTTWSEAIEPIARRLIVENQIAQTLGWTAALSGLTGLAMLMLNHSALAVLLMVAATSAMTAFYFYRVNSATHPLRKLAGRFAPRQMVDPLVEGMLALFSDGEIEAYPNPPSEMLINETAIGPSAFADVFASLMFHEVESVRRAAARRLSAPVPPNLAVCQSDLARLESRLHRLTSYPDLIGMPDWVVRRAEEASLLGRNAKDQEAVRQLFAVLRANTDPSLKGRQAKETLFNIETAVKADSAQRRVRRSTLYNMTSGKHVTGKLIRFQ
jgi:hypothetical protein